MFSIFLRVSPTKSNSTWMDSGAFVGRIPRDSSTVPLSASLRMAFPVFSLGPLPIVMQRILRTGGLMCFSKGSLSLNCLFRRHTLWWRALPTLKWVYLVLRWDQGWAFCIAIYRESNILHRLETSENIAILEDIAIFLRYLLMHDFGQFWPS